MVLEKHSAKMRYVNSKKNTFLLPVIRKQWTNIIVEVDHFDTPPPPGVWGGGGGGGLGLTSKFIFNKGG